MIQNDHEYQVTQKQRALLKKGLDELPQATMGPNEAWALKAQREALASQIQDLDDELRAWEATRVAP